MNRFILGNVVVGKVSKPPTSKGDGLFLGCISLHYGLRAKFLTVEFTTVRFWQLNFQHPY